VRPPRWFWLALLAGAAALVSLVYPFGERQHLKPTLPPIDRE